ncbi:MAG: QacE family quaternary ammonium compound efflux SMR transporter [Chryseobacterium sp.]|nr:MAG: QacE family quaternary ammonium compound efflux SMR transporter [Chryseobacterium sp.]
MNWILIIVAGLFETGFAFCMGKARDASGTEAFLWWLGFAVCMTISVVLMFRSVTGPGALPVGTAYATWTGIGAIGGVLMGIFFFSEPATFWRLFFVFTLIASIVGLKFVSS